MLFLYTNNIKIGANTKIVICTTEYNGIVALGINELKNLVASLDTTFDVSSETANNKNIYIAFDLKTIGAIKKIKTDITASIIVSFIYLSITFLMLEVNFTVGCNVELIYGTGW